MTNPIINIYLDESQYIIPIILSTNVQVKVQLDSDKYTIPIVIDNIFRGHTLAYYDTMLLSDMDPMILGDM